MFRSGVMYLRGISMYLLILKSLGARSRRYPKGCVNTFLIARKFPQPKPLRYFLHRSQALPRPNPPHRLDLCHDIAPMVLRFKVLPSVGFDGFMGPKFGRWALGPQGPAAPRRSLAGGTKRNQRRVLYDNNVSFCLASIFRVVVNTSPKPIASSA